MQPLKRDDPRWVGGYRLQARLGAGGMGIVYLGRSPGGRLVAVKVVPERFARDSSFRARFRREVAAARTVSGTFTAPVLDAAPDAKVPWLVMDYLPGLSLWEAVETFGALPADTTLLLAAALAEALADIHRAGVAHRDLKPGNIMLTAGGPRLIDFGIARPEDATAITLPGVPIGTASFMSPEQSSGGRVGPAGDVFALGAVLAYAATGVRPFADTDTAATLQRVRMARADLDGLTDPELRALVASCLRREPDQRPSAAALLDRLGEHADSVRGTRWLPASLAEEIDRRVAQATPSSKAASSPVVASTSAADEPTGSPDGSGIPILQNPGRRRLLLAGAVAVPAGAVAVTLGRSVWSATEATDEPATARSSRPGAISPSPQKAVSQWRSKVLGDNDKAYFADLYSTGGVVLAAHSTDNDVHALDARTGKILWSRRADVGPADKVTVGPDAVYVVDPRARQVTHVRAVHPVSGATRWRYALEWGEFPWGVVATGSVACVATGNQIRALDAKNGRRRWTAEATGMSITAAAGLVVAAGERVLAGLDARNGRIRWTYKMPETPQYPLIGDGVVFARDAYGMLYAVRADDGKPAWKRKLHYRSSARRAGGGMVFVDEADGQIRALRADTGAPVWSRRLGQGESYTIGLSGGTLWAGSADGTVYALTAADGRVQWTYGAQTTSGSSSNAGSGAVAAAGLVILGTADGHVEAVAPPAVSQGGLRGPN